MDFRLTPDMKTILMSFFLNYFQSLRPIIGTHGNFMMFLVFLMFFWSLLFGLLVFCKYSVAMLVSIFLFCPFSVKILKNLFHSGDTFQYIFCMLVKENL